MADQGEDDARNTVVLPTFAAVISTPLSVPIPTQRTLSTLARAHETNRYTAEHMSPEGQLRVKQLAARRTPLLARDPRDSELYTHVHEECADEKKSIRQAPLSFLANTGVALCQRFSKNEFRTFLSYILEIPAPSVGVELPKCKCGTVNDPYGHHRMSCSKHSSYKTAHNHIVAQFVSVTVPTGAPVSSKATDVPCHPDSNKQADIICTPLEDFDTIAFDVTLVHPRTIRPNEHTAVWNDNALRTKERAKITKHREAYRQLPKEQGGPFTFVPLAATTYGRMGDDFLRSLWLLARRETATTIAFERKDGDWNLLFGRFFGRIKARMHAAIAKAAVLRALGVKLNIKEHSRLFRIRHELLNHDLDIQLEPLSMLV